MFKPCCQCAQQFEITDEDLKFYDKVSPVFAGKKYPIPEPTLCPDCRQQRRIAWRNEQKLYHRTCDLCKKTILAMYDADTKFPVYCLDCWYSDKWDPYDYGRQFDMKRPFFEQFADLLKVVPRFSMSVPRSTMENADYCNASGNLKNCYLIVNSDYSEQCYYGKGMNRCFQCVDCFKTYDCQNCYEVINSNNCYGSSYLLDSYNSENCHFSSNLNGCKSCFGCTNLRNKQFCFFNEQLNEYEYLQSVKNWKKDKTQGETLEHFLNICSKQFTKYMQSKNTENCTGNYLVNSKNCFDCYDCECLEDSKFCTDLKKASESESSYQNYDVSFFGVGVKLCYECSVSGYEAYHTLFCDLVWSCSEIYYSNLCFSNSNNLFGCVGIRHGQHVILNKKYSKAEYEDLVGKIITHMSTLGEWGEFFPLAICPTAYNESIAQEYFPLTKDQAQKMGASWKDEIKNQNYVGPKITLPKIIEATDEIIKRILICEKCQKNYRVIKQELDFYRDMKLEIPKNCPDCRHKKRLGLRNPRKLWHRLCMCKEQDHTNHPGVACQGEIQTSYAPDRTEKVYCESCYLKEIY